MKESAKGKMKGGMKTGAKDSTSGNTVLPLVQPCRMGTFVDLDEGLMDELVLGTPKGMTDTSDKLPGRVPATVREDGVELLGFGRFVFHIYLN